MSSRLDGDQQARPDSYGTLLCKSALAWTVVALVMYAQDIARALYWNDPYPFKEGIHWLLGAVISALLTPFIIRATRRWPIELPASFRHLGLHLAFSAAFGLVRTAAEAALLMPLQVPAIFGPRPEWANSTLSTFAVLALYDLIDGVVAYWIIVSIQAAKLYLHRFEEREQEAMQLELHASELRGQVAQAQIGALKMQLQPHFLFNTLNAIVALVRQQREEQAEEALTRLSDLLRAVLVDMGSQEVPLSRELAYVQLYLSIEQMRFPDRLRVSIDAPASILNAAVPHMGLQPLVENAVRHAIAPRAEGGTITIRASLNGQSLRVEINDDGSWFARSERTTGHGLGLKNLQARLERLYSARAELVIDARPTGTSVQIVLPYRVHPEAERLSTIESLPSPL